MKVLLISPIRHLDPLCGDVVFTESLIENPPEGIIYVTYSDALECGTLIEHGTRRGLRRVDFSVRFLKEFIFTAFCKTVNLLRARKWLFWEPFRIFSVVPGVYDVVHVHVFSCAFRNCDAPIVLSNALPLRYLYLDARKYSRAVVYLWEVMDCLIARVLRVNVASYTLPRVARVIAFTAYLKAWYTEKRGVCAKIVDVVPIYLPDGPVTKGVDVPRQIGFIAKDFDAKGGPVLLKAFAALKKARPDAQLTIIGSEPRISAEEATSMGVTWIGQISREELLEHHLADWDVFAYPTEFDGMPLVLIEVMRAGLAVATSSYRAIPEMVDFGAAGLLSKPGDDAALASNLLRLLDPQVNKRFRRAARLMYEETYAADSVRPRLKQSYLDAVESV